MYYYIANPRAGNGRLQTIQTKLKASLERSDIKGPLAKTLGSGDAFKIAKDALTKRATTIVVIGGDQTLNEVVAAVHQSPKTGVAVGVIPIGKTNTVANRLGITSWRQATAILRKRRLAHFNLMTINDQIAIHSLIFSLPGQLPAPKLAFEYKLKIDNGYTLRGQAASLRFDNQKFIDPNSDNRLLINVGTAETAGGWLNRFSRKPNAHSHLLASTAHLTTRLPIQATLDGRITTGKDFQIALSAEPIALVVTSGQSD